MRIILFACLLSLVNNAFALTYNYSDTSNWPSTCTAVEHQSPINITTAEYSKVNELSAIWPSPGAAASAANAAQTIVITMADPTQSGIRAVWKSDEQTYFYLQQIAFHFGLSDDSGSEHSVYGNFYPLELHFTFFNSLFGTYAAASTQQQGLVAYSVLYNISDKGSDVLDSILNSLNASTFYDGTSSVSLNTINYTALLPDSYKYEFFFYEGSKDYPDCTDNVIWLVAKETMQVSAAQLAALRSFNITSGGPPLAPNSRTTQKIGSRTIYRSFQDEVGEAGPTGNSFILALFFIFASLICVAIAVTATALKNRQYHVIEEVHQ